MSQKSNRIGVARVKVIIFYLVIFLIVGGCISGRTDVTYGTNGPAVSSRTLKMVKIGETSKEWLYGTLGDPTSESRTPDGIELLRYEYNKKVDSSFEINPFLDLGDKKEVRTVYYFELKDGVVTRFWKER
jgi:hypothetical protein